jgi:hypothetical protein
MNRFQNNAIIKHLCNMHLFIKCLVIGSIIFVIFLSIILIAWFSITKRNWNEDYVEIVRIKSPDNKVDAIVIADTGFGIRRGAKVAVQPVGKKIAEIRGVDFSAEQAYGLSVHWINSKLLEIHYKKANIIKFSNICVIEGFGPSLHVVEIKLNKDGDEELDLIHD